MARSEARKRRLPVYGQVVLAADPGFQPEPERPHVYVSYANRDGITTYRVHAPAEVS